MSLQESQFDLVLDGVNYSVSEMISTHDWRQGCFYLVMFDYDPPNVVTFWLKDANSYESAAHQADGLRDYVQLNYPWYKFDQTTLLQCDCNDGKGVSYTTISPIDLKTLLEGFDKALLSYQEIKHM